MKKFMILAVLLFSGTVFSQDMTRVLEEDGDNIKATYFNADGQIAQEGFFKDGKLHGKWVAYDENGNKTSSGQYLNGDKVGKWVFFNDNTKKEVEFVANRVASVKSWQKDALANRN